MELTEQILNEVVKLHSNNPTWPTFIREVFEAGGLIDKYFPSADERKKFEYTEEYDQICKMLYDLLDVNPKRLKDDKLKEITIRIPVHIHQWLMEESERAGYNTLTKYALHSLLHGCFDRSKECHVSENQIT